MDGASKSEQGTGRSPAGYPDTRALRRLTTGTSVFVWQEGDRWWADPELGKFDASQGAR